MSHFTTLVLLGDNPEGLSVDKQVERALVPFDENTEVEEYDKKCYCVGRAQQTAAMERARVGSGVDIKKVREEYWEEVNGAVKELTSASWETEECREAKKKVESEIRPTWEERIKSLQEAEEVELGRMDKPTPDPKCNECKGSGTCRSTYNPKSQWDWWVIGGRWNGALEPAYDPEANPGNYETCTICAGTGKRNDALGKKTRQENPTYTCNGCGGKGTKRTFIQAEGPSNGNMRPVREIKDFVPFAILTPDGEWHEEAKMGWWGMTSGEDSDWPQKARAILKAHGGDFAVLCDLHI